MHNGCAGGFESGKHVVDKIRMMGFAAQPMSEPMLVKCEECGTEFTMEQHEGKCPECSMVYGVTPCHAFDPANIMAAGIDY